MSYKIEISQEISNPNEAAELLRQIADMLDDGYTSGYMPNWSLEKENGEKTND